MLTVTLQQMLDFREKKAEEQIALIRSFHLPIISFSMNIAGPIKQSVLINRGFELGCGLLKQAFGKNIRHSIIKRQLTGNYAIYVVDLSPMHIKKITTQIEENNEIGRLFDMDVITTDFVHVTRQKIDKNSRSCLVCGADGRNCASRRLHSVEEIQDITNRMLYNYFADADADFFSSITVQSLIDEVCTTPKPGLVDLNNSGSHNDMDLNTFISSAIALAPYFRQCVKIGQNTAKKTTHECFLKLQVAGLNAEQTMYNATGGVNTHKGAIFTLGLMCGAAGRLWHPEKPLSISQLLNVMSQLAQECINDLKNPINPTIGTKLYAKQGVRGIRGQAADGFPALSKVALPIYKDLRLHGIDKHKAGCTVLLHLIAKVEDTNMLNRGGILGATTAKNKVKALLKQSSQPSTEQIEQLDKWFIKNNLSPGGCADLLAAVYVLEQLEKFNPTLKE